MKKEQKNVSLSSTILVAGIMAIVGFIGGTRKSEIVNLVLPIFSLKQNQKVELDLSSVQEVYRTLSAKFDGETDEKKLIEGAKKGLVIAAGDEYTTYMDPKEAQDFKNDLNGDIGAGIGVELGLRSKGPTILRILKNNPAAKVGLIAGDILLEVNGEKVSNLNIAQITSKIKGDIGTSVKIKVNRNGEDIEFSIVRQKIYNPSVEFKKDGDIGILTISRFDEETGALARKYAKEIEDSGISKVILDLRGNGGGYVTAAEAVASLWIDNNSTILIEKRKSKVTDVIKSSGKNILSKKQTIVLVNENSASASEIVAGALKDYGLAKIYGVKTFGKGSVQEPIDIGGGSLLKVTIAKWYTPKDKNIDKQGIIPDKEIKITDEQFNNGEDPQLNAAKDDLK